MTTKQEFLALEGIRGRPGRASVSFPVKWTNQK